MEFDINEVKRKLLIKYPFFGSVISNVTFKESKRIDTALTNGELIVYNENFMNSIPFDEQVFALAHEVSHIVFDHIKRGKGKNHKVWNIATDAVINAFLKEDGFTIKPEYVYFEDAINYNVEDYYEKLMMGEKDNPNNEDNQNQMNSQGNQIQDNSMENDFMSNDYSNSSHEYWYKPFDKQLQEELSNNIENGKINKEQLEKSVQEKTEKGEKESFKENKKIRDNNLQKMRNELVKGIQAGSGTNSDSIENLEVGEATKYIDWRLLLKEAVNLDVDWSYQNASIEDGVVTAHLEEIMKPEAEIILDTSGSIDKQLLINFLKECKNIINTSKVKVGCFDDKFYGFQEVRNEDEIEHLDFKGGGGTNFHAAVNAFSNRVENKIIFTDGEATMPNKKIDAIWVVFGKKKITPKGGRVIYIDEEQLERLNLSKKVFK